MARPLGSVPAAAETQRRYTAITFFLEPAMGLYFRKSISVGPFRFNLSKSGLGISTGVRGLRFGSGPRGNYVRVGWGGLHYHTTLSTTRRPLRPNPQPELSWKQPADATVGPLVEIESVGSSQLADSSSAAFVEELKTKRQRPYYWPWVALATSIGIYMGFTAQWTGWAIVLTAVLGCVAAYVVHARDVVAKTCVLLYDLEPDVEAAYAELHSQASRLAKASAIWHVEAQGRVYDRKYHAGASSVVRRRPTYIRRDEPRGLKVNVDVISLGVGRQTLYFLPDCILLCEGHSVAAVPYRDLQIEIKPTRFVEDSTPPSDATIVDRTWRYVNKSGGPDRRFKNNRELPICLYEEVALWSSSGLNELLQVSKVGLGGPFKAAVNLLGRVVPSEPRALAV